ncbi:MAG: glycosyltransferase family 39 protein [Spirulinaceae cyanobacterium RM2_2_10]|nr:glycosyltransferase family 39 protein [Spirulinaceae cyanobacterium RM2_2_10]
MTVWRWRQTLYLMAANAEATLKRAQARFRHALSSGRCPSCRRRSWLDVLHETMFNSVIWKRQGVFGLAVLVPIVWFWLVLYWFGYPSPDWDDLALIGAAMNLARGGEFVNPLLASWVEQTSDRFLIQPPFHSYILAGWLMLTGISAKSLLAFQCLCYICFSVFTALTLRAYRYPAWASFAITVAFAFWMSARGVRHDALSMAFLAAGTWCLLRDRPWRYFWGFMLFGASLLTLPLNVAYATVFGVALVGSHAWSAYQQKTLTMGYIRSRLLALVSAIALSFSLLLLCIDFRLGQLLADLSWHAAWRRAPLGLLPTLKTLILNGYGEITYGSLYALYATLLLLLWWYWRKTSVTLKLHSLTLAITLAANLLLYVATIHQQFNFMCWLAVILLLAQLPLRRLSRLLLLGLAVVVFG